jgi:hypothetical protein
MAQAGGADMTPTCNLRIQKISRWYAVLQQEWVNAETGEREWRDVPTFVEVVA